jgi:probable rRNA maturation factor
MAVTVYSEHRKGDRRKSATARTIDFVLKRENRSAEISVIFIGDVAMRRLNTRYLGHRYTTDVITFPLVENENSIEAEIYINLDQVERQAREYGVPFSEEINRVAIHGVLHLVGFNDIRTEQQSAMKAKEDEYLRLMTAERRRKIKG